MQIQLDGAALQISIHALLAESDFLHEICKLGHAISIHALLAESDVDGMIDRAAYDISIHALLAESDQNRPRPSAGIYNFYPRSPCGERLLLILCPK